MPRSGVVTVPEMMHPTVFGVGGAKVLPGLPRPGALAHRITVVQIR